jgi:hypothetical protein
MERIGPRIAIEKSPETVTEPGALARLARAYPRARYVHLVRHPVATIRSLNAHLARHLPGYRESACVANCAQDWLDSQRRILAFTQHLPPERVLALKAEDVLDDPVSKLRAVARWLSVTSDARAIAAMRHPERSPFARFASRSSGVSGGYDPGFLADPRPHRVARPTSLDPPREWPVEAPAWAGVRHLAKQLGYRSI